MSDYIDRNPHEFKGKSILELGAGAGLPSIASVQAGASLVVVTDYPDHELIENIKHNIVSLLGERQHGAIHALGFLWGSDPSGLPQPTYDYIFMCDVIFNHSEHRKLVDTMVKCLKEGGICWCVFSHYRPWYKERDLQFLRDTESMGFEVSFIESLVYEQVWIPDNRADRDSLRTVYAYKISKI